MIELEELRASAEKAFPRDAIMPARADSWQRIVDLGWLLIELDEVSGGLGLDRTATATVLFEQGRVLSAAPLLPALLGLKAISASPALADRQDRIDAICGGAYVPLNLLPAQAEWRADGSVTGTIPGLFEADMAAYIVADLPDRVTIVPLEAPGVTLVEHPLWDESRRIFDVELSGFRPDPALVLAEGAAARALHDALSITAQLGLAADALGGANAVLEQTVDYLKLRRQFDRPLALFQALKHRVADCKALIAAAEALLWARTGQARLSVVEAGALKAMATRVYAAVCEEAIQLHGGIGLTQEHPCHRFLKRAFLDRTLCGNVDHWEEQAGRAALAEPAG